ncbi:MAG: hypothetical protein ACOC1P_02065 [Minisyncoccales bacterium]
MVNIKNISMVFLVLTVIFIAGCTPAEPETVNNVETDNIDDGVPEGLPSEDDTGFSEDDAVTGNVVAVVNGEEIESDAVIEIQQVFAQQGQEISQEDAINQVVSQVVLTQKAKEEGFSVSTEEAEDILETQLTQQNMSLDDYKEQIELQGTSYEEELDNIKDQLANQNYVSSILEDEEFDVSDEEAREFYSVYEEQSTEEVPSFEELEPQIVLQLQQQKQQEYLNEFIQQLMDESDVEIK